MATANNADGGGFDLDGATTNSVLQYNVSWNNNGYGYQLYDFFWGPHQNNTARYNVTIDDAKVTSSRPPTPGQGVLVRVRQPDQRELPPQHRLTLENDGDSDRPMKGMKHDLRLHESRQSRGLETTRLLISQ